MHNLHSEPQEHQEHGAQRSSPIFALILCLLYLGTAVGGAVAVIRAIQAHDNWVDTAIPIGITWTTITFILYMRWRLRKAATSEQNPHSSENRITGPVQGQRSRALLSKYLFFTLLIDGALFLYVLSQLLPAIARDGQLNATSAFGVFAAVGVLALGVYTYRAWRKTRSWMR